MLLTVLRRWSRCCSYSVWLCGLYYRPLHVLKSSRALRPRVSSFLLASSSPRLGKRGAGLCASHKFVCFVRVSFSHVPLLLGVEGWLRFVIMALWSNYVYINWYSYTCPYCMLLLLHSINGLVTQQIDKKVQMYAYESNRHRNNLFLPWFPTEDRTPRTMKDSVSVIICCKTCYMQKHALKGKSNFWSICFSEFAAKYTKKWLNSFTILYVYNRCYANIRLKRHIWMTWL